MLVKVENLKFKETFGKTEQDVLFSDALQLEILRTCG